MLGLSGTSVPPISVLGKPGDTLRRANGSWEGQNGTGSPPRAMSWWQLHWHSKPKRCGKSSRTSEGIKSWLKFKITSQPAFLPLQKGILQPSQTQLEQLVTKFDDIPASLAAQHIFKALPPGVKWSWEKIWFSLKKKKPERSNHYKACVCKPESWILKALKLQGR